MGFLGKGVPACATATVAVQQGLILFFLNQSRCIARTEVWIIVLHAAIQDVSIYLRSLA